jgi:hypothetical protein
LKKYLNYFLVAIILIGLPLFAWYYLSKGTQMRKDAMAELEVKSEVGNFQSVTDSDSIFYSESFHGKRWIVGIIGADSSRLHCIELLKNIYKQSKEEFAINIFTIVGLFSGELIPDMGKQLDLVQDRNWIKTYMAAKHIYLFSEDAFSIPEKYKNENIVVLVDEFGKIRQYYSLSDELEVKKMVRQIPVFLSLKL